MSALNDHAAAGVTLPRRSTISAASAKLFRRLSVSGCAIVAVRSCMFSMCVVCSGSSRVVRLFAGVNTFLTVILVDLHFFAMVRGRFAGPHLRQAPFRRRSESSPAPPAVLDEKSAHLLCHTLLSSVSVVHVSLLFSASMLLSPSTPALLPALHILTACSLVKRPCHSTDEVAESLSALVALRYYPCQT